jgi:REP element-mobilizing transposase RayT
MSDTYSSLLVHCVFSTYRREPTIPTALKRRLWSYMGGIARACEMKALAVGGTRDHVHLLLSLPPKLPVSKAIQVIKANSSKWINDEMGTRGFAWQKSYSAFSIGISQVDETVRYIDNQEQHHMKMQFDEELNRILQRHGIVPFRE